ncbi:MAG TPA: hypothetical protein VFY63_17420 [Pseudorhizobium sp.]|nr:hypothetical protein [Pseudorhizobium sp.]
MNKKFIAASALGLVCLTVAGCVSEGGSYVAYDSGPRYQRVDRDDWDRGRRDRDRHDRYDGRDRDGRRGDDDRRGHDGWRDRDGDRDRDRPSQYENNRDGRWVIRDGRRIWVPERR